MQNINSYSYIELVNKLLNKKVHFISDCEFFPNFDVNCFVYDIYISKSGEIIFETKVKNKKLSIGSNMKNLKFEISEP